MDVPTCEPDKTTGECEKAFVEVVEAVRKIKETYVDPTAKWYKQHTAGPRFWFRSAGVMTILLSATLPAVAAAPEFHYKYKLISCMSVVIAILTGASSFFHWEQIWHGNMSTKIAIEQFSAKWELELTNARLIVTPAERIKHVYMATDDLLSNVRSVTSSETEGFFRALQFPQSGGRSNAGSEQK